MLGDSHSELWRYANNCQQDFSFEVTALLGASALGLKEKPGAPWSTRAAFRYALARHAGDSNGGVILNFGEIDASHLIHVRAAARGESVEEGALEAADRIAEFAKEVVEPAFAECGLSRAGSDRRPSFLDRKARIRHAAAQYRPTGIHREYTSYLPTFWTETVPTWTLEILRGVIHRT